MITIFCDFSQFLAKKLALFSNTNVMIKILHNLALFRVKNANFRAEIFGENLKKIITLIPGAQSNDFCLPECFFKVEEDIFVFQMH
jgi:hypothetical protein